jgi:hypothetical protein
MQRQEVSGAVRPLKWPLGVKWLKKLIKYMPVPAAVRSKAWVCGRSLLRLGVRIPPWAWMSVFVIVVCCQLEVSASS